MKIDLSAIRALSVEALIQIEEAKAYAYELCKTHSTCEEIRKWLQKKEYKSLNDFATYRWSNHDAQYIFENTVKSLLWNSLCYSYPEIFGPLSLLNPLQEMNQKLQ